MNDTTASSAQVRGKLATWLMLIADLPPKPDYLRVKLRRRVQRLGALALKGAVYVLPNTPDGLENFQWLKREIAGDGGEASLCEARLVDGWTDADVVSRFNAERDAEYAEFMAGCDSFAARWSVAEEPGRAPLVAERTRLFSRLEEILGRDHFTAPRREEAMQAIEKLAVLDILPQTSRASAGRADFTGRTWATRAGVKVDRIASAWLIRRHVDPAAQFAFVSESEPAPRGSVRFDMFDGEFSHDATRCTFEVLLDQFEITDPALRIVGQLVHDLDLHDDAFSRPETAGFALMIDGIVKSVADDADRLTEGARMLDLFVAGLTRGETRDERRETIDERRETRNDRRVCGGSRAASLHVDTTWRTHEQAQTQLPDPLRRRPRARQRSRSRAEERRTGTP